LRGDSPRTQRGTFVIQPPTPSAVSTISTSREQKDASHYTDEDGRALTTDHPQNRIRKKQQEVGQEEHHQKDNAGFDPPRHRIHIVISQDDYSHHCAPPAMEGTASGNTARSRPSSGDLPVFSSIFPKSICVPNRNRMMPPATLSECM